MKKLKIKVSLLGFLACIACNTDKKEKAIYVTQPASVPIQANRKALVIGNADYDNYNDLKNPVNDANAVAQSLSNKGFQVTQKNNLNFSEIEQALDEFKEQLSKESICLFFFSGHGVQIDNQNYLLPIKESFKTKEDVKTRAISVGSVLERLEVSNFRIVMLDACRNNPFSKNWRGGGIRGLTQTKAPFGTLISYATDPDNVASDGSSNNSPYTLAFLKALEMDCLESAQVFKRVREHVRKTTKNSQTPWESSSVIGDFYFNEKNCATQTPPPASPPAYALTHTQVDSMLQNAMDFLPRFPKHYQREIAKLNSLAPNHPKLIAHKKDERYKKYQND